MVISARENSEYPWYTDVANDSDLQQGDFISGCPILILNSIPKVGEDVDGEVEEANVIIMSQSCDLINNKINSVLICPFFKLEDMDKKYKHPKEKNKLKNGMFTSLHLLNKWNEQNDYMVVDFGNIYSMPFPLMQEIASDRGERKRLLPPYREHMSQAFAKFFMRVGIPSDIPNFS